MKSKFTTIALVSSMVLALAACEDGKDGAEGPPGDPGAPGSNANSITVAADRSTILANDLRGLTYARVGANANKIYASGHVGTTNATRQAVVARFNADGSVDATFGGDGFVELEATPTEANGDETSIGVAELQSGDVVVAVNAADAGGGQSVYLFRLTPAGVKAAGWGDADGKVEVAFGWPNAQNGGYPGAPTAVPSDTAWDVQVDRSVAGDRVVVFGFGSAAGGVRTDNDRYTTRLDITATSATVDPTFNGGAALAFNSAGTFGDNQRRGIVEANGKIVSAGYTNLGTGLGNHVMLFRLTAAGALDATFGGFSTETATVPARPGVAVFNPFKVDGGVAESYGVGYQQSTASYVTAGYGSATGTGVASTLGYKTTLGPDAVIFRVSSGTSTNVDTAWGGNGTRAVQSEGKGFPTNEDRARHMLVLPDDRALLVGRFGGTPAAMVLTAAGQLDEQVFGDGIVELPHPTIAAQFYGVALSQDGKRVALTTDQDVNGARLVILKVAAQ